VFQGLAEKWAECLQRFEAQSHMCFQANKKKDGGTGSPTDRILIDKKFSKEVQ